MMVDMDSRTRDIVNMPRGGPDASWLDRRLQTDRLEYLDRDDVDHLKSKVMVHSTAPDGDGGSASTRSAPDGRFDEVADVPAPKILELGAGLGGLSSKLLESHPTAEVTVTDIDPSLWPAWPTVTSAVNPRATVREMDATAIDAPDGYYDLAMFALSLHHLPPELAVQVFAAGTRAAKKLLIVDLPRPPAPLHAVLLAVVLPLTWISPLQHDGFISSLRAYSRRRCAHSPVVPTRRFPWSSGPREGWPRQWRLPAGPRSSSS